MVVAKKICLIGDFGVGKTSLIKRFVDRSFSDEYLTTVGVKISRKLVTLASNLEVQLVIWDLEGQTKFKSITPTYLQGATGAIIVCDVSRPHTIQSILEHQNNFLQINPRGAVILALNKTDLVSSDHLQNITIPIATDRCHFYQTSAKTGQEVDKIFHQLSQQMLAKTP